VPVVALIGVYVALALNVHDRSAVGLPGAFPFDCAVAAAVGLLVLERRPRHPAGWILVGFAAVVLLQTDGLLLSIVHYRNHVGSPGVGWLGVLSNLLWIPLLLSVAPVVALFPDGRVPARHARTGLGLYVLLAMGVSAYFYAHALGDLAHGRVTINGSTGDLAEIDNPHGALAWWYGGWGVLVLTGLVAALALLVVKFRRADGETQQQLRWFLFGAVVVATGIVPVVVTNYSGNPTSSLVNALPAAYLAVALAALPITVGVGILRFHLYDLNVVLSRSIAYGALALMVSAVYLAIVAVLSLPVHHGSRSLGVSLVATVLAAAAFQPLRARAHRMADRIVYGRRATPYEAVTHLADRLAGSYDVDRVLVEAAQVLVQATAAERADVWLRAQNGLLAPLASWPADVEVPEPLQATMMDAGVLHGPRAIAPVRHQGVLLGAVGVTKRVGETASETELRLLGHLASQAGLVLHNAKLATDLQRRLEELVASRQRLVRAQDEARRRLERDLHDGAQQRLIALNMKLGQLGSHFQQPDREAEGALEQLRSDLDAALDDIRATSRGIYPPLLADRGLEAALRSHVRTVPVPVTIKSSLEGRCSREVEAAAYFCTLEALQNVCRHAAASLAVVRLDHIADVLRLEVEDDGHGFDQARRPAGSGLTNIADRADALGGSVELQSAQGSGTTIVIKLPL
jgi:signal transduction histidine kinase